MEYEEEFKFLNLEIVKRKNAEELKEEDRQFIKLNLLDKNYNPCVFFVFNKEVMKKLLNMELVGLQILEIHFELVYTKSWNVRLVDIHE